ncbi:MAG: 50S ribosomal protein L1 [Rickettsiales bacterium]|jgi:large subunit ribosomal protein L1|nr:50S ribosomal protein L1 [Rickettsiales bacterium]
MRKKKEERVLDTVDIDTAISLVKKNATQKQRKFVETVDLVFNLNIDPKQSNQNVRGAVALPAGTGRDVKIIVFTDSEALQRESLARGAVRAGMEELMAEIEGGFENFDYCIAVPGCMRGLSKIAKKLGPKGLMPNPKNGNVTDDVLTAIDVAKKGKINFKNDRYGILHTNVGKVNFSNGDLKNNINAVVSAVKEAKPDGVKGKYVKSAYLTTTMGPSVAISIDKDKTSKNSGEQL